MPDKPFTIYTVGHSTRPVAEFEALLQEHGVQLLVDIRSAPRSRANPQFNKESLCKELPSKGCKYEWLGKQLGGLRKHNKCLSVNDGWHEKSFRGFADYMQTADFAQAVQHLLQLVGSHGPACLMCAETVPWRCHRSLVSDALAVHGCRVLHILQRGKPARQHQMTGFAVVEGKSIIYPAPNTTPAATVDPTKRRVTPANGRSDPLQAAEGCQAGTPDEQPQASQLHSTKRSRAGSPSRPTVQRSIRAYLSRVPSQPQQQQQRRRRQRSA